MSVCGTSPVTRPGLPGSQPMPAQRAGAPLNLPPGDGRLSSLSQTLPPAGKPRPDTPGSPRLAGRPQVGDTKMAPPSVKAAELIPLEGALLRSREALESWAGGGEKNAIAARDRFKAGVGAVRSIGNTRDLFPPIAGAPQSVHKAQEELHTELQGLQHKLLLGLTSEIDKGVAKAQARKAGKPSEVLLDALERQLQRMDELKNLLRPENRHDLGALRKMKIEGEGLLPGPVTLALEKLVSVRDQISACIVEVAARPLRREQRKQLLAQGNMKLRAQAADRLQAQLDKTKAHPGESAATGTLRDRAQTQVARLREGPPPASTVLDSKSARMARIEDQGRAQVQVQALQLSRKVDQHAATIRKAGEQAGAGPTAAADLERADKSLRAAGQSRQELIATGDGSRLELADLQQKLDQFETAQWNLSANVAPLERGLRDM